MIEILQYKRKLLLLSSALQRHHLGVGRERVELGRFPEATVCIDPVVPNNQGL